MRRTAHIVIESMLIRLSKTGDTTQTDVTISGSDVLRSCLLQIMDLSCCGKLPYQDTGSFNVCLCEDQLNHTETERVQRSRSSQGQTFLVMI